jgi:hypothetical protein
VFLAVALGEDPTSVQIPKTMRQRELEDLQELNILERTESGEFRLAPKIQRLWNKAGVR